MKRVTGSAFFKGSTSNWFFASLINNHNWLWSWWASWHLQTALTHWSLVFFDISPSGWWTGCILRSPFVFIFWFRASRNKILKRYCNKRVVSLKKEIIMKLNTTIMSYKLCDYYDFTLSKKKKCLFNTCFLKTRVFAVVRHHLFRVNDSLREHNASMLRRFNLNYR